MKKKILKSLVLASIMSIMPLTVYANENHYIYSSETAQSAESSCQVTIHANLPERMGLNCYVVIQNTETGQTFLTPLYAENNYLDYLYVPAGTYEVIEQAIYDDTENKYPFIEQAAFTLDEQSIYTIETTISNYEEVENIIAEKIEKNELREQTLEEESVVIEPVVVTKAAKEYISNFDVETLGNGEMAVIGDIGSQNCEAYYYIKVVEEGPLGQVKVAISYDDGASFEKEEIVPLSGIIVDSKTGLTLRFGSCDYTMTDGFKCFIPDPTKAITYNGEENVKSYITVDSESGYAFDVIATNHLDIVTEIRKTGGLGKAVARVSLDNGVTYGEEFIIPLDGIYKIPEYDLILQFSEYEYQEENTYTATARYEEAPDMTMTYVLIAIAVFGLVFGFFTLSGKKTPKSAYRLQKYTSIRRTD